MTYKPRAYVARVGDILESLDGVRRVEVVEVQPQGWQTYRLRNTATGRVSYVYGSNLPARYRVVSRGAESAIEREGS